MIYMIATSNHVDVLQVRHLVDAREYLATGAAEAPKGATLSIFAHGAPGVDAFIENSAVTPEILPVLPQSGGLSFGRGTASGRA